MSKVLIFLLVAGFLVGAVLFLGGRFACYLGLLPWPLRVFFGLLFLLVVIGVISLSNKTTSWAHVTYLLASFLLGALLYLLLATLAGEGIRLLWHLSSQSTLLLVLLFTTLTLVTGVYQAMRVRTTRLTLSVGKLEHPLRILHLSDLHLGHWHGERFLRKVLEKGRQEKVDVCFITGDLFDGRWQLRDEVFEQFRDPGFPVFFVEGNHERYTGVGPIVKKLQEAGVHVLRNELVEWDGIRIAGLQYLRSGGRGGDLHARRQGPLLEEVLRSLPWRSDKPTILLHHAPVPPEQLVPYGIDLFLAGHTHGGQFFPFTLVAAAVHPYNRGLHTFRGMYIYISQGTGTFGPPIRTGTRSELTLIELVPAAPSGEKAGSSQNI